ncbi:MAG: TonB-dependent receptor, partial [Vicinamibacterales bacterium]
MRTTTCALLRACLWIWIGTVVGVTAARAQGPAMLVVRVQSPQGPVAGAIVVAGASSAETDAAGRASLRVAPGVIDLTVAKPGFGNVTQRVTIAATAREMEVVVDLVPLPDLEEEVFVVASTRTGRRVEDQPTRVEVLDREEIEEKMLMTPGDIVMMLNEMGGLRVQATSPSIGAASVRVQGMQGRYTRFLSDGLPLFGQQVGGLGLLQIPPMDLGQVEVIKGVASAFYGAGAMGGVVNLLTRRP